MFWNGTGLEDVTWQGLNGAEGLALDWIGRFVCRRSESKLLHVHVHCTDMYVHVHVSHNILLCLVCSVSYIVLVLLIPVRLVLSPPNLLIVSFHR